MELKMRLKKAANKMGGDRYEAELKDGSDFVIYFPQSISRPAGSPRPVITITIS